MFVLLTKYFFMYVVDVFCLLCFVFYFFKYTRFLVTVVYIYLESLCSNFLLYCGSLIVYSIHHGSPTVHSVHRSSPIAHSVHCGSLILDSSVYHRFLWEVLECNTHNSQGITVFKFSLYLFYRILLLVV